MTLGPQGSWAEPTMEAPDPSPSAKRGHLFSPQLAMQTFSRCTMMEKWVGSMGLDGHKIHANPDTFSNSVILSLSYCLGQLCDSMIYTAEHTL